MLNVVQADRIRAVIHWYTGQSGLKQMEIANKLGYKSKTHFSAVLNGKRAISQELPHLVARLDPRINIDYLLGESDDMLLGQTKDPEPASEKKSSTTGDIIGDGQPITNNINNNIGAGSEYMHIIAELSATIKSQQESIKKLIDKLQ